MKKGKVKSSNQQPGQATVFNALQKQEKEQER